VESTIPRTALAAFGLFPILLRTEAIHPDCRRPQALILEISHHEIPE
jgi:hypothetical protein